MKSIFNGGMGMGGWLKYFKMYNGAILTGTLGIGHKISKLSDLVDLTTTPH